MSDESLCHLCTSFSSLWYVERFLSNSFLVWEKSALCILQMWRNLLRFCSKFGNLITFYSDLWDYGLSDDCCCWGGLLRFQKQGYPTEPRRSFFYRLVTFLANFSSNDFFVRGIGLVICGCKLIHTNLFLLPLYRRPAST